MLSANRQTAFFVLGRKAIFIYSDWVNLNKTNPGFPKLKRL
jgi:hypothetical protein